MASECQSAKMNGVSKGSPGLTYTAAHLCLHVRFWKSNEQGVDTYCLAFVEACSTERLHKVCFVAVSHNFCPTGRQPFIICERFLNFFELELRVQLQTHILPIPN